MSELYTIDDAGHVFEDADPRGRVNRAYWDALGRTTKAIKNYVVGTVSDQPFSNIAR